MATMAMTEQSIDRYDLTLFERCQLAYSYDKLVKCENKASLCRQMGINWDSYYHARRIIEIQLDQQWEYKKKADELKQRLCQPDPRGTTEKKRIAYASKKLKKWQNEIKAITRIPECIRYFRLHGYSNMFIDLTVKKHIPEKSSSFGPFSILGQCLCCGLRLCECEPNHSFGDCPITVRHSRLEEINFEDWMERDGLCVCGHHGERHQIGWITEETIIPYECRDCNCWSNLSDYSLIVAYPTKTNGDHRNE